jgi:hypothetical protein
VDIELLVTLLGVMVAISRLREVDLSNSSRRGGARVFKIHAQKAFTLARSNASLVGPLSTRSRCARMLEQIGDANTSSWRANNHNRIADHTPVEKEEQASKPKALSTTNVD